MSLLMEALRKAEEAKRLAAAAQKSRDTQSTMERPTEPLHESPTPSLLQVDSAAIVSEAESNPSDIHNLDFEPFSPLAIAVADEGSNLHEVEFDFQIDENFGLTNETDNDAGSPVAAEVEAESQGTPSPMELVQQDAVDTSSSGGLEYVSHAPETSSPLTLEATTPVVEGVVARDDDLNLEEFLVKLKPSVAHEAPSRISTQTFADESKSVSDHNDPVVDLDANAVAAFVAEEQIDVGHAGSAETEKPVSSAAPEQRDRRVREVQRRQSAQAVFAAKKGKGKSPRSRKLVLLASVAVIVPLLGVGAALLLVPDLLVPTNQYNIPPQAYTDIPVPQPEAIAVDDSQQVSAVSEALTVSEELTASEVAVASAPVIANAVMPISEQVAEELFSSSQSSVEPIVVVQANPSAPVMTELPVQAEVPRESVASTPTPEISSPAISDEGVVVNSPGVVEQNEVMALVEAEKPAPSINIVRTETGPAIDPQITLAYAAFQERDYITARAHYLQALRNEPLSRDALLGVAAVSMQLGEIDRARDTYSRLLELDPNDALARFGLMETMPGNDSVALESELKSLFEQHPYISQFAFSLGNLYASQGRWSDAQQSYFDALLAAKAGGTGLANPDYAFNLAVSLEQLNQLRPAYNYYREALESSLETQSAFDPVVLRARIDAIERMLP